MYVKCPSVNCAVAAVNALHGRWFAGQLGTEGCNTVFFVFNF